MSLSIPFRMLLGWYMYRVARAVLSIPFRMLLVLLEVAEREDDFQFLLGCYGLLPLVQVFEGA